MTNQSPTWSAQQGYLVLLMHQGRTKGQGNASKKPAWAGERKKGLARTGSLGTSLILGLT
jgi:hypothetical protein